MYRAPLTERLRALGLELRDAAQVVEIGEAHTLPGGELVLEHLISDGGLLLEAQRVGSSVVAAEHLLLGVLGWRQSSAGGLLEDAGVDPQVVRGALVGREGSGAG